ncbi:MAG TPA: type I-U CRISPR-associated protein Csb2 [Pyrinomonadaceae bacterium]|nr:type I-U CRISPR-associated protein Csb2 [Pyrinomonadaceae bacterium]
MQLNLIVTFADGRYHGRRSEEELEFPPSPSRVFQSLIAGSHCGAYGVIHSDKRDRALQWLESLEAPVIETPVVCETGKGITNYVPNNDDNTPSAGHVRTAKMFLAKSFPAGKTLLYRWSFESSQEADENAAVLCAMARLMTHLGQHQDTVYVSGEIADNSQASDGPGLMRPIERDDGNWTSPKTGALGAYKQRYQAWLKGDSRDDVSVPARRVEYRSLETISFDAPMALFELWRNEDERLRYDPRDLRQPAAMVRHAMIEWLEAYPAFRDYYGDDLTTHLIAGHEGNQEGVVQFNGAHVACVPIPSLNEDDLADGLIRRVLLVGFGCQEKKAIELFESVSDGINGAALKDQSVKIGYLKKASLNDSVLRLFTRKAYRVWRSVTPIILTGLMRRGRGAEVLIARALKQAGMNENDIESIATFSGPIVPKTARALDYRIEKDSYLSQTPRYHAEVIFKRPVEGALVIGRGRHYGFGLMIPCSK